MKSNRIDDKTLKSLEGQIAEWKKEGKDVRLIELEDDPIDLICKVPGEFELKKASKVDDDYSKNKQLVLDCVLYPAPEEFAGILMERPMIVTPVAVELVKLSGATQKATVKNL
jgi:hypothetical protein